VLIIPDCVGPGGVIDVVVVVVLVLDVVELDLDVVELDLDVVDPEDVRDEVDNAEVEAAALLGIGTVLFTETTVSVVIRIDEIVDKVQVKITVPLSLAFHDMGT
jgi:hypothetical protein